MSETQLLSDILNDSPCTELLRLRNREIIVLFLYETFYKHREPVAYDSLKMRLSDYLSSINLEKDEERTAEKLQDDTTGDSNIVASAKFKAYWKIISGYSLRILLLANGKLTGEDGAKTVTVHYSISRDGSAILGYRSDTDSIGDEAEIGNYSPDYTNQVFSTVGSSEFEIVTVSESLDVWSGGVANGELTTVISLRVEVLN